MVPLFTILGITDGAFQLELDFEARFDVLK